jgi:hypothetical protein
LREMGADQSMHKAANKDILDHARKRQIVLELLTLQEELEGLGMDDGEIQERLDAKKAELEAISEQASAEITCAPQHTPVPTLLRPV